MRVVQHRTCQLWLTNCFNEEASIVEKTATNKTAASCQIAELLMSRNQCIFSATVALFWGENVFLS